MTSITTKPELLQSASECFSQRFDGWIDPTETGFASAFARSSRTAFARNSVRCRPDRAMAVTPALKHAARPFFATGAPSVAPSPTAWRRRASASSHSRACRRSSGGGRAHNDRNLTHARGVQADHDAHRAALADTAAMLLRALLASGEINVRKVDGWETLAAKLIDQPIDLAGRLDTLNTCRRRTRQIPNHILTASQEQKSLLS